MQSKHHVMQSVDDVSILMALASFNHFRVVSNIMTPKCDIGLKH